MELFYQWNPPYIHGVMAAMAINSITLLYGALVVAYMWFLE